MNEAGIFDNIKMSIRILAASLNRFHRFDEEDKEVLKQEDE